MSDWSDLRELRRNGLKPSLPVVIATDAKAPMPLLSEEGCLVIVHTPRQPLPVELLDGLRVWLFLRGCDRAQAVVRAMNHKGVKPSELHAWCECSRCFDSQPVSCEVAGEWH